MYENTMDTTISEFAKKLLGDDAKKLIKAGFFDAALRVTPLGSIKLMAICMDKFRAEFMAEADAVIKENEE